MKQRRIEALGSGIGPANGDATRESFTLSVPRNPLHRLQVARCRAQRNSLIIEMIVEKVSPMLLLRLVEKFNRPPPQKVVSMAGTRQAGGRTWRTNIDPRKTNKKKDIFEFQKQ